LLDMIYGEGKQMVYLSGVGIINDDARGTVVGSIGDSIVEQELLTNNAP